MNDSTSDLLLLLGGAGIILLVATAIGKMLAYRQAEGAPSAVIDNLNARINAWWAMVILLGIAFLGGRTGVVILFGLISFAALREFMTLTNTEREDHIALVVAFFVIVPVQYTLVWHEWYGLYSIFIPVYAFLLMLSLIHI